MNMGCAFVMQIQFHGMTIYDCGPTYNPKHPERNPACTLVTDVKDTLRFQVMLRGLFTSLMLLGVF